MATIHLMVGFIGFGKTTIAKKLEKDVSGVCLTHDDFMVKLYGRDLPCAEFHANFKKVDEVLWDLTEKIINAGRDVIMDYGFWGHQDRAEAYQKAKRITKDVVFHDVCCDMKTAKERILKRSEDNNQELDINEEKFDGFVQKYEPWGEKDNYPVVLHNAPTARYIGRRVSVKIDRPKGSKHPKFGFEYPVNYGFVPFTKSGDGEELDVYVLGVDEPLKEYEGRCIALIHRTDDDDDKLIVVPENTDLSDDEIEKQIAFQEKWFKHALIRDYVKESLR